MKAPKFLFRNAFVLARRSKNEKRKRCKIIFPGTTLATVQELGTGIRFLTEKEDIRPAKITLKGVKLLGLKEVTCSGFKRYHCNPEKACFSIKADTRLILNAEMASEGPMYHIIADSIDATKVNYMHEVQLEIIKLNRP